MKEIYYINYVKAGGEYQAFALHVDGVIKINEHPAQGDGDKWFWTIIFEDGHEEIIFNPITICKK